MEASDRQVFVEVVIGFAELKGKQLSAPALELYWAAMKDWPLVEFLAAASYLLKTSEFMPTPHDFEKLRKAGRPTVGEAWGMVLEHAQGEWRKGHGTGNPLVDKSAQIIGGYRQIALCDTSKLGFLERRFCEHYKNLEEIEATRNAVPELTGDGGSLHRLAENQNASGKLIDAPASREKIRTLSADGNSG